jgi:hypothetical protein
LGAARKTCVPALATQPVPTVVTGARTKRMMSWIASPGFDVAAGRRNEAR